MTQFCHSRTLKRNIGEKWVKYIINKNIKSSRRSSYHLQRSLTQWQQPCKHFVLHFFLYEIYAFYHIDKDVFELPLQAARLRVEFLSFLHVVSSFLLFNFSSYFPKKYFFIQKYFLTYRENNFCRLSFKLLKVSLEI